MDSRIIAAGIAVIVIAAAFVFLSRKPAQTPEEWTKPTEIQQPQPAVQELTEDQAAQAVEQELDSSLGEMTTEELEQALLAQ